MRRRLNPKRVSFASDVNLCQVRLFLSEDSPSQVGFSAQDHLQAKPSHASGITSDDNLPPGFEAAQASNLWRTKLFQIPVIKWESPPRFILEANWRVVSGEESQEREVQKQREMRVLEAIYPRPSAIPLNPSAPAEHAVVHTDNQHTPLIPITSVEEDDTADTILLQHDASAAAGPNTTNLTAPLIEEPEGTTVPSHSTTTAGAASSSGSRLEPDDTLTVALAALSSIMANDHGNLIDSELLIKILSDPQIIGQLVTHQGGRGSNLPAMSSNNVQHNGPVNVSPPGFSFSNPTTPLPVTSGPFNLPPPPPPPPRMVGPTPSATSSTSPSPSPAKDMNYYKSLIQQHGGERQDTLLPPPPPPRSGRGNQHIDSSAVQEPPLLPPQLYNTGWGSQHIDSSSVQEPPPPPVVSSRSSRDPNKPKIMKPCMFFNSQRGCRHGAKCAFSHDSAAPPPPPSQRRVSGFPDVQSAKRMKMEREITGT